MTVRMLQRSFAGGEVTPEFWGRIDDAKYQTGLAVCRNFLVKPQGPVENRPGTVFVREVKHSDKATRLIPFSYSPTQTMALELGDGYLRFHTAAATLLYATPAAWTTATAYATGDLRSLGGASYYCTTAHTSGVFATDLAAGRWYALPAAPNIYEIPTPYSAADLFDIHVVQSADVMTLVHQAYAPMELKRFGATQWVLSAVNFNPLMLAPTGVSATATGGTGTTYRYVVTAVGAMGTDESVASSEATCNGNLFASGAYNTITWSATTDAERYYVYKHSGGLFGYVGQADGTTFKDDNIAADMSRTPPINQDLFNAAGDYPGAVSYFEQRRCFGGTQNQPQNLWMTKSGTESNMGYSLPIRDDDSIQLRVAAREATTIRHIVPLSNLLLLTSGAEWRVTSVNSDAVTPSTISVAPQSYIGANNVAPVLIANNIVYAAARGGHVREMAYAWQANGYISGDLSLRAPHLFDNMYITDMAYAKAPYPVVWAVSSGGKLLGLTYIPEQQVGAWHQHDTDGAFESVAVVAEGEADTVYVVVRRTVSGAEVRYVECLHPRPFADPEDAFFVDCGLTYSGAVHHVMTPGAGATVAGTQGVAFTTDGAAFAATDVGRSIRYRYEADGGYVNAVARITGYTSPTQVAADVISAFPAMPVAIASGNWSLTADDISGLDHLEGATVNVLGDGAVMPQQVVTGGAIHLPQQVSKAHVGLPITADMQTLPLAYDAPGAGQGIVKNVNKVWVRTYRSGGIFVGPGFDRLVEVKQRTTEAYGTPIRLKTDEIPIALTPSWAAGGQICMRQADPLPLTVISMTAEVAVGGG